MLSKNPEVKLLAARSTVAWSPDAARETAETFLLKHHNQIDAFICNNSGMAFGVIQALQDQGLADATKVFVAGSDGDLRNIRPRRARRTELGSVEADPAAGRQGCGNRGGTGN